MPIIVAGVGGSTTYPDDTDLASIANIQAATSVTVTGSGTVVNTKALAELSALKTLTVTDGATIVDNGGLASISTLSKIEINGGTYEDTGGAIKLNLLSDIVIGPTGGVLKIDAPSLVGVSLTTPISYVDSSGNTTSTPPKNFVLDLPYITFKDFSGNKYYVPIDVTYNGTTTVVQDNTGLLTQLLSLLNLSVVTRTITLEGNPFDLTSGQTKEYTGSTSSSDAIICFLSGSMIDTPSGLVAVEDLSVGDLINVYENNKPHIRSVKWSGYAHCTVKPEKPDDMAGYPVRILKDAISPGVPFKDMLITAEHCLFFNGTFIPARMLVNGRSVFYDKSITSYTYYHIETESHSVIMADGMLTESYLDTGNRRTFQQKSSVFIFNENTKSWGNDAAAPLDVSREHVEPIYRKIAQRADKMLLPIQSNLQILTSESNLHLCSAAGHVIKPLRNVENHTLFMIPGNINTVQIVSNSSRPSDTQGPFVDDRRNLGVLIGKIFFSEGNTKREITHHLIDEDIEGWHSLSHPSLRWTNGCAYLHLGPREPGSIGLLSISIEAAGPYCITHEELNQATA